MTDYDNTLVIIPARAGSQRLPGKNYKLFKGKPLISYSIEFALESFPAKNIFVSTNDDNVLKLSSSYSEVNFVVRPEELATSVATSEDVILHLINEIAKKSLYYKYLLLLQPTTPFRSIDHLNQAISVIKTANCDGVVSVKKPKSGFSSSLVTIENNGSLKKLIPTKDSRRISELNGSFYLLDINKLKQYKSIANLTNLYCIEMNEYYSLDIDTQFDWEFSLFMANNFKLLSK